MNAVPEIAPRVTVLSARVSDCDMDGALQLVDARNRGGGGGYVCFTNVHAVVECRTNPAFRAATNESLLSVADGRPVFWVGRACGAHALGHVPGPDFFARALERFAGHRHFFYGSTPATLARLEQTLRARYPLLQICGVLSPPFGALSSATLEEHYQQIRESRADFVWVGLGAPKQELWMAQAWARLAPAQLFGVGAAFDFHAGTVQRAPHVMGWLGLEWLYRLWREPRRLWRRYLVTNSLFIWYVLRERGCRRSR